MATLVPPRQRHTHFRQLGRTIGVPVPVPGVAMSEGKPPLLRLLCLHGYRQNQRSFHERTGALRKALRGRAELVSVNAPHRVRAPAEHGNRGGRSPGLGLLFCVPAGGAAEPRAWWFSRPEEETFEALEEAARCQGLEQALETVARACAELGPFDGLLGFSQGAALAAIVCALQQRGDARFPFRFAVLIAGFKSRAAPHGRYFREPIAAPSLHVLGESDRVIPAALSRELAAHFREPAVLSHPGGHFVPAAASQRAAYLEFLARF
ncbi:esterase OVCA2 isoform X2 [Carettochelys insculpta]|uniref:esterase OVCA2 isoform X2 n=1 Tax=Carettochelys insculpta TaxID=44489 RepID=UPI003EB8B74C